MYLGGYGIIRFFMEGIRTDQLKIWDTGIPISQLLGILLFIASVIADIVIRLHLRKKS